MLIRTRSRSFSQGSSTSLILFLSCSRHSHGLSILPRRRDSKRNHVCWQAKRDSSLLSALQRRWRDVCYLNACTLFLRVFYAFLFVYTKGPCSGRNTAKTHGDGGAPRQVVLLQCVQPTMKRHPCLWGANATLCSCFLMYFLARSVTRSFSFFLIENSFFLILLLHLLYYRL